MLLLIPIIPLCVIAVCITVHFRQHFKFSCCSYEASYGCIRNVAPFDFFPVSFLLYMLFVASVCVLIIVRFMCCNGNVSPLTPHPSLRISSSKCYIDVCLYVLIIIASLWESLFAFYRYYTTKTLARQLYSRSICAVLKTFSIYMFIFILLFLLQTQRYYYLFAPILLSHFFINMYWILSTARIIMQAAQHVSNQDEVVIPTVTRKEERTFLHNVILMRSFSILSSVCCTIYMALLMVTYTMRIVYYFPFIWSVSIVLFACNFVRNRQYIENIYASIHKCRIIATQNKDFIVYVENIDKHKENKSIDPQKRKIEKKSTPVSVPLFVDDIHPDFSVMTVDHKSHSTGNLRAFLPKKRRSLQPAPIQQPQESNRCNVPALYVTPSTFSSSITDQLQLHPMPTPMSEIGDGTVYMEDNEAGAFPAIQIKIIPVEEGSEDRNENMDASDMNLNITQSSRLSPISSVHSLVGIKSQSCQELQVYADMHESKTDVMKPIQYLKKPDLIRSLTVAKPVRDKLSPLLDIQDIPDTPASFLPIHRSMKNRQYVQNHLALNINPIDTRSVPMPDVHHDRDNKSKHRSSHSKDHLVEEFKRKNRERYRNRNTQREASISSVLHLFVAQGFCDGMCV